MRKALAISLMLGVLVGCPTITWFLASSDLGQLLLACVGVTVLSYFASLTVTKFILIHNLWS